MHYEKISSPIGELLAVADDDAIVALRFAAEGCRVESGWSRGSSLLAEAGRQLEQYFRGQRTRFELPLNPAGTEFQQSVWTALQRIPYGKTVSYSDVAQRIGRPRAVRAVGAANGANPIPIVIPCHRVIGKNGSLTGFAAGLSIKQRLLVLEGTG